MPGILNMDNGVDRGLGSRDVESKKRSHHGKLVNGEYNALRKDSPASAPAVTAPPSVAASANGTVTSTSATLSAPVANQIAQQPPVIAHVQSSSYHSLSKLITRITQECYNELYEALNHMGELSSSQPNGNMANGMGNFGMPTAHDAETSRQKKLIIMKFAHDNRAKFIKLLVLTEWGKKASVDVSKLVDLCQWARQQTDRMDELDYKIEYMKRESNAARQFNPDIRTALEILGTRKAEWIPDMGFVPPPPMSSAKTLLLLRYMNTALATRLLVHEKVPQQLSKWRIGDGRVTFIVDGAFELDLMSFVEDSSDQFHFIDMRLLFSPAPVISPDSAFMARLKMGVDNILRGDGLEQCFSYLNNFTLTHKISVLETQANELLRTGWAGSLRTEFAHRVLWIQYWLDKPGKKNWIEIGLSGNRPKDGKVSWRAPPTPSLAVRWFREGVQVKDVDLNFDWKNLSVERMVKRVIALHIGHLLRATHHNFSSSMIVQATFSETNPSDCRLEASIGSPANVTTLSIEPITGKYTLRPATLLSSTAENAINRSQEASGISTTVTHVLARSLLESIQQHVHRIGWHPVARQALRIESVKAAIKLDVLRFALFWPRGWSTAWALAVVVDASGESWWICEIGSKGSTIQNAQKIVLEKPDGRSLPISHTTLKRIERVALHQLSYLVTTRALEKEGKTYSLRNDFAQPRHPATVQNVVQGWVLHLKTSDLLTPNPGEEPWLELEMRIMCQGFRSDYRNVWHIAEGTMVPGVAADMQKLMSASPQNNFKFSEGGRFSILLSTPFGQEIVSELKARLRDLNRLRSFATTLQKRKMVLQSSSLEQVQFRYGRSLSVKVLFGQESEVQIRFGDDNPHNRIRKFLTDMINERSPIHADLCPGDNTGLDRFCTTLIFTRPLLTSLSEIENRRSGNVDNPAIHSHALGIYRITYTNPPCSFDIRLRPKDDKVLWVIEDNEGKPADLRPKLERNANFKRLDGLKTTLQKLFKESGDRWWGVRTGMVAEIDGVPDALRKLNETVKSCYAESGVRKGPNNGVVSTSAMSKQPNGSDQASRSGANGALNAKQKASGRHGDAGREIITIED